MDHPEWSPRTAYTKGTLVTLDGKTYEALTYTSGVAPDSTKAQEYKIWRLIESEWAEAT